MVFFFSSFISFVSILDGISGCASMRAYAVCIALIHISNFHYYYYWWHLYARIRLSIHTYMNMVMMIVLCSTPSKQAQRCECT